MLSRIVGSGEQCWCVVLRRAGYDLRLCAAQSDGRQPVWCGACHAGRASSHQAGQRQSGQRLQSLR